MLRFTISMDIALLRECMVAVGTEDWAEVADKLQYLLPGVTPRRCRERAALLLTQYQNKTLKKKGTEEEFNELSMLLGEMERKKAEAEKSRLKKIQDQRDKKKSSSERAKWIRNKAMETLKSKSTAGPAKVTPDPSPAKLAKSSVRGTPDPSSAKPATRSTRRTPDPSPSKPATRSTKCTPDPPRAKPAANPARDIPDPSPEPLPSTSKGVVGPENSKKPDPISSDFEEESEKEMDKETLGKKGKRVAKTDILQVMEKKMKLEEEKLDLEKRKLALEEKKWELFYQKK